MTHTLHLNDLVSKLVTHVAMSFPVKVINNVSLYDRQQLIATCFWKHDSNRMQLMQTMHNRIEASYFTSLNKLTPTSAQISGTDLDDLPFNLHLPIEFMNR